MPPSRFAQSKGILSLFWRVRRCPQGHIYVVFAAGQHRPKLAGKAYDPHASWHLDGRYHNKSYDRVWQRRQRQCLDSFVGAEYFLLTTITPIGSEKLPQCDVAKFDRVIEIDRATLEHQSKMLSMDLVSPGISPPAHAIGESLIEQWSFQDQAPWIVLSLYNSR